MSEYRNVHLCHFEDLVFHNQINQLVDLTRRLISNDSNLHISKKIDGSPSIVMGINPENNKFFVGMKSTFSAKPKVFYTPEEISDAGYSPTVKSILINVLDSFVNDPPTDIVQGDFLFLEDDLKYQIINGKRMATFTPNTITYAIPPIKDKKMGIAFHTAYGGPCLTKLHIINKPIKMNYDFCWTFDPTISKLNLDVSGIDWILNHVSDYHIRRLDKEFMKNTYLYSDMLVKFYNYMIREQIPDDVDDIADLFMEYVNSVYRKKIESLSSRTAINNWTEKRLFMICYYRNNRETLENLFCLHSSFQWIKQLILGSINTDDLVTLIKRDDQLLPTSHEGLVILNDRSEDNKLIKMVNRREFSYNNFTKER